LNSSESSVKVFSEPPLDLAAEIVREGIANRKVVLIVGNCSVDYSGRASSRLEPGDRLIIIKEDGSVLVHRPKGYEPVNWQPPPCLFETHLEGGFLVVRAIRRRPRESLRIEFSKLYMLSVMGLTDSGEFSLYASEEDMRRAILIQPSIVEEGLKLITYEKKVEPGFIDLYGVDKDGRMVVIEIKRRTAGKDAALQLARYVESVKKTVNRRVRGILVAPRLAKGVQRTLISLGLDFKPLNPKRCAEILKKVETKKLIEFL